VISQLIKQIHEIMGSIKQANPDHKIHKSIKQTHEILGSIKQAKPMRRSSVNKASRPRKSSMKQTSNQKTQISIHGLIKAISKKPRLTIN
jgi:hypothetical protein